MLQLFEHLHNFHVKSAQTLPQSPKIPERFRKTDPSSGKFHPSRENPKESRRERERERERK